MFIQPIDYFLAVWFLLVLGSTVYVAVDQFNNNPEPRVMKWGFILVTLYMGPIALLLYVLADKEPRPGEHEEFIKPLWKQGVGSTIHCVAGDATGIILAAAVTAALGLPMWLDLIIEYLAGFAFGLFIFQALFMKSMMGGTYWQNVRKSFVPEFISMNFMMAGMGPVMSFVMMGRDMRAMVPTELLFWGAMSIGVIAGFAMAYPWNIWLVVQALKHGLMTERGPNSRFDLKDSVGSGTKAGDSKMGGMDHGTKAGRAKMAGMDHGAKAGETKMAGMDHGANAGASQMASSVTPTQLAAVGAISVLALLIGMFAPANWLNLRLSAREVGGAIMPPGMIMDRDTPADAMRDMAAVDPRQVTARYGLSERGARNLEPRIENGVKVFTLTASVIRWTILPDKTVDAYAFNGQVPGPTIRFKEGDHVRIDVINHLPQTTSVHWHGLILPNVMDGAAMITQAPIENGQVYHYEFTAVQSGTYLYHSHDHIDREQALGLYGALIIDPATPDPALAADLEYTLMIQEWLKREGLTYPAMPMDGAQPNFFTFNGKAFPATDTIHMRVGQTLKVRMVGSNNAFIHPIHIHGGPFQVVARDGMTLSPAARFMADTVNIAPGQRYDVIWKALKPGKWLIHCHIGHHTTNNNVETNGGGGLMMLIDVAAQQS
ncbi:MAG TPA: multicopper oxidase domain-containing protein [Thermoanaerobaculia bacterium]|nr:multicopper oxidase domain-containing protein [Thermoanaerobaculia bacterium]